MRVDTLPTSTDINATKTSQKFGRYAVLEKKKNMEFLSYCFKKQND
jgi:hypothetical protein